MECAIRIVICDNHPVLRYGLARMLKQEKNIEVVAEVSDSRQLIKAIARHLPEIVIIDVANECCDVDYIQESLRPKITVKFIVYTSMTKEDIVDKTVKLGVYGYLLKKSDFSEMVKAIHTVHRNGTLLDPEFATILLRHMREKSHFEQDSLSKRELQVLALMAEGESNRTIASKLFIGECTVKFHVSSILTKLNVKNRTEAAAIAIQSGMLVKSSHNI